MLCPLNKAVKMAVIALRWSSWTVLMGLCHTEALRSWLLSPLENKAIKKPRSRHSREKPLSGFLCTENSLCVVASRLQARKRALAWPTSQGGVPHASALSYSSCCNLGWMEVGQRVFLPVFGLESWSLCLFRCIRSQRVGSGWSQTDCWGVRQLFIHNQGAAYFRANDINLGLWFSPRAGSQ